MKAWVVDEPGPIDGGPLRLVEKPVPAPGPGEVRVRVSMCAVCRTDLHLAEGDLPPKHARVVPGHEAVGTVDAAGEGASRFATGDRIGVPWLAHTDGVCRFCRTGRENLCVDPRFTGWDVDGGYAEYLVVDERYAYALPAAFADDVAAPLLCAGIIGYRALRQSGCPPGGRLGIYGFGGSAHLTAQVAMAEGTRVHVLTRSAPAQQLALDLGAASGGATPMHPPNRSTPPSCSPRSARSSPRRSRALDRGGTLAVAGIHLSDIPPLRYAEHLFEERVLRSVTANTRDDGREFLATAARIGIEVTTTPYRFDQADAALRDLAHDRVRGVAVLDMRR